LGSPFKIVDHPHEVSGGTFPVRILLLGPGEGGIEHLPEPVDIQLARVADDLKVLPIFRVEALQLRTGQVVGFRLLRLEDLPAARHTYRTVAITAGNRRQSLGHWLKIEAQPLRVRRPLPEELDGPTLQLAAMEVDDINIFRRQSGTVRATLP